MRCHSCGNELPVGAGYCPVCGTITAEKIAESGVSPYAPTIMSSPPNVPQYPSTGYGTTQQNPYEPFNPYGAPLQATPSQAPPPPVSPPPRRSALQMVLLVGVVVLLIAGSGVIYYAVIYQPNQLHAQASATALVQSQVQSTATMHAQQATRTAYANTPQGMYSVITSGTPVLNDALSQNDSNNWSEGSNGTSSCVFTGGAYHVSVEKPNNAGGCYTQAAKYGNFAYQVEMTLIRGVSGGIFFRADAVTAANYVVIFGSDGTYTLTLWKDNTHSSALKTGTAAGFKTGFNQANLIAVIARGSNIYLYVNKQYIASVTDGTLSSGIIGMGVDSNAQLTEAAFRNLQVWNA
ncbi:MAG: zinc ribbon domain-containing protein [Chloroflexi bacterium]|nr:zinc ribbon domain-containing protein [Chloroflexota bacterium]